MSDGSPLPAGVAYAAAVASGDFVYVIGGGSATAGTADDTVYVASIDTSSGELSTFSTATSLPQAVTQTAAVASNGFIYVFGGSEGSAISEKPGRSTVYYTSTNSDGSLNAWQMGPALPQTVYAESAVVLNNWVYVIGGDGPQDDSGFGVASDAEAPVFSAEINSDGSLTSWTTAQPIPGGRALLGAVGVPGPNVIYVVGGQYNGSGAFCEPAKVIYAQQNSDGTLGDWTYPTTEFQVDLIGPAVGLSNNMLIVGGGISHISQLSSVGTDNVYAATIGSNGQLGSWSQIATLPNSNEGIAAAANDQGIYFFGGASNGDTVTSTSTRLSITSGGAVTCPGN